MNQKEKDKVLRTWDGLNAFLTTADEKNCTELLDEEKKEARRRKQFLFRIHSRLNYIRAHRERDELAKLAVARNGNRGGGRKKNEDEESN